MFLVHLHGKIRLRRNRLPDLPIFEELKATGFDVEQKSHFIAWTCAQSGFL
jgi:hypothetical protein